MRDLKDYEALGLMIAIPIVVLVLMLVIFVVRSLLFRV
jgi:hypothetical protein